MNLIDEAKIRLKDISIPQYYADYQINILNQVNEFYTIIQKARQKGYDVTTTIESKIAYDLSDRVAKMHNIDISDRLRSLLKHTSKEKAALKIAEEIAVGEYGSGDLKTRLEDAVRVSLAVVTEGVTVAPLQGISDVQIKENKDGSKYLSISFAGPIRSAGGTEAALTMLIADQVRKVTGLDKYQANSFDDETGRFIEELRLYEREVGNFQFKILDEDIHNCISNLPVELDGVDTDPVELVIHRGLKRIQTNRVRGGALRVMNDGLIGRNKKLLKLVETLNLEGWDWLGKVKGAIKTGDDDTVSHRMSEVITGRPVLSMNKNIGGFRLRYGRCFNTGFATIGIHNTIPILLDNAIVVGTQIKMDVPGKASTIALIDTIEPPVVKLNDGTVLQINTKKQAQELKSQIEKILYLGDILISYGDFLENNAQLLPASYVEEIWALELFEKLGSIHSSSINNESIHERLIQLSRKPLVVLPTVEEAFDISKRLGIPLHPRYSFFWDSVTIEDVIFLNEKLEESEVSINDNTLHLHNTNPRLKDILERLGVDHSIRNTILVINNLEQIYSLKNLLPFKTNKTKNQISSIRSNIEDTKNAIEFVSKISGVTLMPKFASSIAVRVGRPEKAAERKMKPPVHVLFPVGSKGGATRDLLKALKDQSFYAEIANRYCINCKLPSTGISCSKCGADTPIRNLCIVCKEEVTENSSRMRCRRCGKDCRTYSPVSYPLKVVIEKAQQMLGIKVSEPLKGVKMLMSKDKAAEPLEKGILRKKHSIYTFKDGTVRFDATNEPLTHFKPKWIMTDIEKLKDLGYTRDYLDHELISPNQLAELLMQDVVIPIDCAKHLLNVAKFVDEELVKIYHLEPCYNASSIYDLIGQLIVGLAPHTSVGIVGRIIGFTNSQVCLASPIWHSAKCRDCDGAADSLMLLMDIFLNFSYDFLLDKIGGLMDAPLLIQPIVLPYEVQRQAHNVDVVPVYPLEFYEATWKQSKAGDLSAKIETIKNRIGSENQFFDYAFTHFTGLLTTNGQRSAYSRLNTMGEKLE